jgi:hypothetical protein
MDDLNHPTGFTYDLSVVQDYPGYEWLPEPDENGRTIYKPHKMEKPAANEVREFNSYVDQLVEMARQKMIYANLEDNHSLHRQIGSVLYKWRSEGMVRIHPSEVEALTVYQNQLLTRMDEQRTQRMVNKIEEGFQVEVDPEGDALVRQEQTKARTQMGLPPAMTEGFKK